MHNRNVYLMIAVLTMVAGNIQTAAADGAASAPAATSTSTETKVKPTLLDTVNKFEKGKTTYNEVVSILGEPKQENISDGGIRTVIYSDVVARSFVFFSSITGSSVIMQFDKQGVLISKNITSAS